MFIKKIKVKRAIEQIAKKEGTTAKEICIEIEKAMLIGLYNPDPDIREKWEKIPCKGESPTPEELILYMSENMKKGI